MAHIKINDIDPLIQYTASAAQTVFPYPFPIFEDGDLVVDIDGTIQTLTTNYTVSGAGTDNGGNVTLVVPATGGEIVTIYRDVPIERTTDYQIAGDFRPDTVNTDFDRIVAMVQQNERDIGRSLRLSLTDTTDSGSLSIPSPRVNKYIFFDSNQDLTLVDPPLVSVLDGDVTSVTTLSSLTALTGMVDGSVAVMRGRSSIGDGGQGTFVFRSGDQSSNVTADPQQGIWVAPTSDATGASGAWQRVIETSEYLLEWWTGSATEVAAGLQGAVDLITTRGTIKARYAAHTINTGITIGARTVEIDLSGGTLSVGANMTNAFLCDNASGKMIFTDGTLDGQKATYTVSGNGIQINGSNFPEFYNFTVQNFTNSGVSSDNSCTGKFLALNSYSNGNGDAGWRMQATSDNTATSEFLNSGAKNNIGHGATITTKGGISAFGGDWEGNGTMSPFGGFSAREADFIRIIGLKCKNNFAADIFVGINAGSATVTGNVCESSALHGISVDTVDEAMNPVDANATVTGNTCLGQDNGIRINGCLGYNVSGNTVRNTNTYGVVIQTESGYGVIDNNTFVGANTQISVQTISSARIGKGNHWFLLAHGTDPIEVTSSGVNAVTDTGFTASVAHSDTSPARRAAGADITHVDTSLANKTFNLPEIQYCGPGQKFTVLKSAAANTMNVSVGGSDVIFNSDGTTATTDAYTNLYSGATYISVQDTGVGNAGWVRMQTV